MSKRAKHVPVAAKGDWKNFMIPADRDFEDAVTGGQGAQDHSPSVSSAQIGLIESRMESEARVGQEDFIASLPRALSRRNGSFVDPRKLALVAAAAR
jgi:hypothetical protein